MRQRTEPSKDPSWAGSAELVTVQRFRLICSAVVTVSFFVGIIGLAGLGYDRCDTRNSTADAAETVQSAAHESSVNLAAAQATVEMSAIWQLVLVSCIIGAGIGFAYGALPALVMAATPVSETAAANKAQHPHARHRNFHLQRRRRPRPGPPDHHLRHHGPPLRNGFRVVLAVGPPRPSAPSPSPPSSPANAQTPLDRHQVLRALTPQSALGDGTSCSASLSERGSSRSSVFAVQLASSCRAS